MIRQVWKPIVLLLVTGIMAADLFLDYRAGFDRQVAVSGSELALDESVAALPVGTSAGERAPDFVGRTLDGQEFQLSDLQGKTVVVNIFASWCAPCRLEAPHLVEVSGKMGGDVVFIGLNLQETPEAVAGFKEEFQIDFPLVLNEDGLLTELYRPIGLPTSWVIDESGVVRYVHAGPVTASFLERAIRDVQAGRQPDPFATS